MILTRHTHLFVNIAGKKHAIDDDTGFVSQIRNVLDWVENNKEKSSSNTADATYENKVNSKEDEKATPDSSVNEESKSAESANSKKTDTDSASETKNSTADAGEKKSASRKTHGS